MALAVGAGYVLGRRRKMRLAMGLGAAAVTGGFGGLTRKMLQRGTGALAGADGMLGKLAPELGDVTEMVRGELVDVGKAAALAAVRGQLNRVSDRLHEQADSLRVGRENREEGEEEADGTREDPEDRAGRTRRTRARDTAEPEALAEPDEDEDFDGSEEDAAEEPDGSEQVPARPRRRASSAAGRASSAAGRASRTRSSVGGEPVRRTRG
jgi:hypothetical protein